MAEPRPKAVILTANERQFPAAQRLESALTIVGFPVVIFDQNNIADVPPDVSTLITTGEAAYKGLELASGLNSRYPRRSIRELVLVVPMLNPEVYTVQRDLVLSSSHAERWARKIKENNIHVVAVYPKGEILTGTEFFHNTEPRPDSVVIDALNNPNVLEAIVKRVTRFPEDSV